MKRPYSAFKTLIYYLIEQVSILLSDQSCVSVPTLFNVSLKPSTFVRMKLDQIKRINMCNCRQCEICERIGGGERFERLQTSG